VSADGFAWVNGAIQPRAQAAIPVDDFAFRFGAAAFETMLACNGRVFRLEQHLDRLSAGLRVMRVDPPSAGLLAGAIDATLEANAVAAEGARASVRLAVSAGVGRAPDLRVAQTPTVVVTADPAPTSTSRPRLAVSRVRVDHRRPWGSSKMAQFLPYLLAREDAREQGAEDALLLNHDGHVAELATSNVFFVVDGGLVTPSLASGPVPGITRDVVVSLAQSLGVPVSETEVTLDDVRRASAAFATNSLAGVAPVTEIVGVPPASPEALRMSFPADHPLLIRLARAYEDLVLRECAVDR
jgi:branched-chain amino acid aminotransferase